MKIKDKYIELKDKNKNVIVLIKSGVFYLTFDEDALVLNSIFNYQIKLNKLGFPIKSIDKVKEKLYELSISYLIYENNEINSYIKEDNKYLEYFNVCKKQEFHNKSKSLLLERINFLLDTDPSNYDKIRSFIDEL